MIYSLGLIAILSIGDSDKTLLSQYESKLTKEINKHFEKEEGAQVEMELLVTTSKSTEAYRFVSKDTGYLFLKEVKACSLTGCTSPSVNKDNLGSEYYDIAVLTDKNMNIVSIKVLDYFSDYGYEISSKRYLKKYRGINLCQFSTQTPQVDGISGATVSYNALISSLQEFCDALHSYGSI